MHRHTKGWSPVQPRRYAIALGVALALTLPTLGGQAASAAPGDDGADRFTRIDAPKKVDSTFVPAAADPTAKVSVMLELKGDPVAVVQAKAGRELSSSEKASIRKTLKAKQDGLKSSIKARGGKVLSQMQSAYNGMRINIARNKVNSLRSLPGVAAVKGLPVRHVDNTVSVPYLGVPQVWESKGYTGAGVKVAVIDTGIDFTHADFGGPGTVEAYQYQHTHETVQPAANLFGPAAPRVKGGWDFVGDAYNADTAGSSPKPDPNPIDCYGHGTHVAGTVGGSGVTEDGKTYTGPYDSTTPSQKFKVGPGVAPKVDFYAYKVFGCEGTTSVTTEAIDRAVAEGMDVINMSLGSVYGHADDPDAVAASNAVAAGVVVVASAGNSGPNPYLVGSPSTGRGVVSVAANDSTESFPGALLHFDNKTMEAINANGLSPLPSDTFTIVNVTDDPATAENEALGCSVNAFTKAGISTTETRKTVAVVQRGVCARVAKAIYGQQAGADAVIMVNNAETYPPYEGPITSNPDDGSAYTVTIPFLGVRESDGPVLAAANGKPLTMTEMRLKNPGFTKAASFSSGGPRTGDSGFKPSLVAPGVSIMSAGVGTGTEGEINSGTSMAAPHVAGVAALNVEAHPTWSAAAIASALTSTADPDKVGDYRATLTGVGQVDPAQSVSTDVVAYGDAYTAKGKEGNEEALNFGFAEFGVPYTATKTLTVANHGTAAATYAVSVVATEQSRPATMTTNVSSVTVPAGGTATVDVTVTVDPNKVPPSDSGKTQWRFFEVSGNVVLTADSGVLRVPYLLVPRMLSEISASAPKVSTSGSSVTVHLANAGLGSSADFYTWGLSDAKDITVPTNLLSGLDLRAAGVRSFPLKAPNDLLVFAVNNWTRWSNAASLEFDVLIDKNNDGKPDVIVFATDYGLVASGDPDGRNGVFIYDVKTKDLSFSGFLAVSPTDSSTLLLPVMSADLGKGGQSGRFLYTVASYDIVNDLASDQFSRWATYNANAKAIADGDFVSLGAGASQNVTVALNPGQVISQRPLGIMVVALDNKAGAPEALLVGDK